MWRANGASDLPLAPREHPWDASAAEGRVRAWAGAPDIDWAKYRKAHFAFDDENAETFGGYKLPFCDIQDGKLVAVPRAIFAVAAALMGARGGVDLPGPLQTEIKNRVAAYYKRIDENLMPPWETKAFAVREGRVISEANRRLIENAIQQSQEAIDALRKLLEETAPEARDLRNALMSVRALANPPNGNLRVGGYAIVYGGRDLYGTWFSANTDTWADAFPTPPLLYDHGFDPAIGPVPIGRVTRRRRDGIGEWVEAEVQRNAEYAEAIEELIERGALGWSTGTAEHLAEIHKSGEIRRWPIVEVSLTPTPAEPRTLPAQIIRAITPNLVSEEAAEAANSEAATRTDFRVEDRDTEMETNEELNETMINPPDEVHVPEGENRTEDSTVRDVQAESQRLGLFAVKRVSGRGFGRDDQAKELAHYLRTGQLPSHIRAAVPWEEGTGTSGGYLVPDDLYGEIVTKLSELSVARRMGAAVYNTSRDTVRVPVLSPFADMGVTAEGGAYAETEVTPFTEIAIPVYKFTRAVRISEELLDDSAFNIERIVSEAIAMSMAQTENKYFLAGSGTGEPQGALTGATVGVTAASPTVITAGEWVDLYFSLASQYRNDPSVAWAMADSTEQAMRKIQATSTAGEFLFQMTPAGELDRGLMGKPLYNSAYVPAIAAGNRVALLGAWKYYVIVQRGNLVIQRNPYLYSATGYIGFFAKFRAGGAVLLPEAFKALKMGLV